MNPLLNLNYLLSRIKKIFDSTVEEIKKIKPSKVILIDYPGFNLRLAKKLSALNFDVTYFILPQVWAWKESRTKILQPVSYTHLTLPTNREV